MPENLLCAKNCSSHFANFKSCKIDHVGCYVSYKETENLPYSNKIVSL